ncbi:transcription termination/antitermination NusG family protein [Martelella sp. HB161492]|uniref:transcription termination/antitermination protein NusG n=1 Tax=Martelella sp. HB161492 TaxID=2720726 RepID=UPI0015918ECE|nr:transcription termination/antitermination NusG family protein [Martelella sp. HB161492]
MLMRQFDGKVSGAGLLKLEKIAHMRRMEAHFIDAAARRHWQDKPELARWIVLSVDGRKAASVVQSLADSDVESFMPMMKTTVIHSLTHKKIVRMKPLMPGYVMVKCVIGAASFAGLKLVSGVIDVLHTAAEAPYVVSEETVSRFMVLRDIDEQLGHETCSIVAGDFVEIIQGPFAGIRAFVRTVNKRKMVASIKATMFAGKVDIPIPLAFIEKV